MSQKLTVPFKTRFRNAFRQRKEIDVILEHTPDRTATLKSRIHWLFDLIEWIRREGLSKHDFDFASGAPQAARVRYLLQVLDRNSEWKRKVARSLRSIIKDTKGLELFIQTGLFTEDHFTGELIGRINEKILPQVPNEHELSFIFTENFYSPQDMEWFQLLDQKTFSRLVDLFHFEVTVDEADWNSLKLDCEQALFLLGLQVQGLGLSADIRKRLADSHFERLPFHRLPEAIENFITEPAPLLRIAAADEIKNKIVDCRKALAEVQSHLNNNGVSVQIVYKIDRLEHLLHRISEILYLLQTSTMDPLKLEQFIKNLVADNIEKRSISSFINKSFSLLSRKIVERNAETGEHYITRNSHGYLQLIKGALGGGVITSFTALAKLFLHSLHLESFHYALVSSLNYSISFLAIHFNHFTLGTKQPSSTAPALAAKMHHIEKPIEMSALVDEIVNTIRSQVASTLGNVCGVVPVTYLICWLFPFLFHHSILSNKEALHTIESFSILGPTPFYAFFTGILLWASSVFSGWFENWFTFHQIAPALAANRKMNFIFGADRSRLIASFLKRNCLGISSNISLGFMLGMTPSILQFLGFNIEVRHVTLSSGALAASLAVLPNEIMSTSPFWQAVLGIISMAILNVAVAFSLALFLAVKARQIQAPKRRLLYKAVLTRLGQKPLSFIWPQASAPVVFLD